MKPENIIAAFLAVSTAFFAWKNYALSRSNVTLQEQQARAQKEQSLSIGQLDYDTKFRQDLIADRSRAEGTIERQARELAIEKAERATERARNDILLEKLKWCDNEGRKKDHDIQNYKQKLVIVMEMVIEHNPGNVHAFDRFIGMFKDEVSVLTADKPHEEIDDEF